MVEVIKVKRKKASEWGNTDARNRKSTRLYDTDTELAANDDDVGLVKGHTPRAITRLVPPEPPCEYSSAEH